MRSARVPVRGLILAGVVSGSLWLSGCGGGMTVTTAAVTQSSTGGSPTAAAVVVMQGTVHGGEAPVSGAHVYVMAVGASSYGAAAQSVLSSSGTGLSDSTGAYVLTNSVGAFTISSTELPCTSGELVYLLATGGNAGVGSNSATSLMAAYGACPTTATTSSLWVNEVSTVATAYALSAYAADATHIASSGSALALTGIKNAFAAATNLYSSATGAALATTPGGNGAVPQATINTLANVLSACVNTPSANSPACVSLFDEAQGSKTPQDTASAAINIAHEPNANVAALFGLQASGGSTFQPALSVAPTSWILPVTYTGGGLNSPAGLAVDAEGNVWAANSNANTVTELNSLGVPANANGFTGGGLNGPFSIGIDAGGNVWAVNTFANSISELSSGGTPVSPAAGFTGGGLYYPLGIAIDAAGDVWVGNGYVNSPSYISHFTSAGVPIAQSGFPDGIMGEIGDVSLDGQGNVWASGFDAGDLSRLATNNGPAPVPAVFAGGTLKHGQGVGIDATGNVWVAAPGNSTINEFSSTGQVLTTAGLSGGGLASNRFLTIDGAGSVWSPSTTTGTISQFTNAGLALNANGYTIGPGNTGLWAAAIDGSGNVWVSSQGASVIELVGAATPVVTPVVAAATSNRLGVRP